MGQCYVLDLDHIKLTRINIVNVLGMILCVAVRISSCFKLYVYACKMVCMSFGLFNVPVCI